jgi:hypothetical protein
MTTVVPHPFLFRFSFPVRRREDLPRRGRPLLGLTPEFSLPDLSELRGVPPIADVRLAWNDEGLGISVEVRGKQLPLEVDPRAPTFSDGLQIWIDTRNTQTIHRASRFCHHFCFVPTGGGASAEEPFGVQLPIAQAREPSPLAAKGSLLVQSIINSDGYRLEAWLRREQLHGFDPSTDREAGTPTRLGFYYAVRDAELGEQPLTVDSRFPFAYDPSLWSTLELTP